MIFSLDFSLFSIFLLLGKISWATIHTELAYKMATPNNEKWALALYFRGGLWKLELSTPNHNGIKHRTAIFELFAILKERESSSPSSKD